MPSRKGRGPDTTSARPQRQETAQAEPPTFFPFARYTSVVGVHTSLLTFTALLLPGTSPSLLGILEQWDFSKGAEGRSQQDIMQALTENPVRTVAWICGGALILQSWWASWLRSWMHEIQEQKKDSAEVTKQKLKRDEWAKRREVMVIFGQAAGTTLVGSIAFYVITVLFGAPLSSHPLQTYSLSLLLAILTILPPAYTLGPPLLGSDSPSLISRLTWVRLFAELSPRTPIERALVYPAVGGVAGSWLGAIPIGLDWERPWQAWPLTPTFGAVGGFIAGSLIALMTNATLELAAADRQAQTQPPQSGKVKKS